MFTIRRLLYRTSDPSYVCFYGTCRPDLLLAPELSTVVAVRKRGGQDLTNRDIRLSQLVRQNQAFSRAEMYTIPRKNEPLAQDIAPRALKSSVNTFRGLIIPEKPRPPAADGCAICVYDLYLTSLETYREDMATVRSRLQAENIPDSEWPGQVRTNDGGSDPSSELDVSMSAFAELERALRTAD